MRFLLLVVSIILLVSAMDCQAQCAMCKATIEANQANTGKYGIGLNTGILYLMVFPYIAFAIIGYFWYKNAKAGKLPHPFRRSASTGRS